MKKALTILVGCMAGSFATAIAFVVTMTLTLPESDMAHGQMPFQDPLVFPIMSMAAGLAGVIVFPFVYLALRKRDVMHCAKIVLPVVLFATAILTAIDLGLALFGSFIVLALALVACVLFGRRDHVS